jgi:hypothetical protein
LPLAGFGLLVGGCVSYPCETSCDSGGTPGTTVAELGAEPVLGGDVGVVVFAALDADTDDSVDELLDEPDDPQAATATAANVHNTTDIAFPAGPILPIEDNLFTPLGIC